MPSVIIAGWIAKKPRRSTVRLSLDFFRGTEFGIKIRIKALQLFHFLMRKTNIVRGLAKPVLVLLNCIVVPFAKQLRLISDRLARRHCEILQGRMMHDN
ncbi:MAG: hypothetical protein OXR62_09390 [Ahrensia sp.]|nr:hypothetical protein [Ahrensia sp.]